MYEPNQLVEQAILFATEAHRGQLRKGSNLPYILHPLEAAAIVAGLTDDPEVIAAAVLHDVLEDTSATPGELEAAFGPRVTALVQSESENKRPHLDPRDSWQLRSRRRWRNWRRPAPRHRPWPLGTSFPTSGPSAGTTVPLGRSCGSASTKATKQNRAGITAALARPCPAFATPMHGRNTPG